MQAVKWRIAFFYFDMNIFQIRICLAETFDRSPFLSERLNDGQPADIFTRRARHILHGLVRDSSGLFTMPPATM